MAMMAKEKNEAGWKSKDGFKTVFRKYDFKELPNKPPQSKVDELSIPYVV